MRTPTLLALLAMAVTIAQATIPLPSSPDWTSNGSDFSTGGAFADVNGDHYLDFCTSNGNDMAQNRNAVYLSMAGTLEDSASWRSADQGYFGHCYAGDVNNDGLPDLAVAYLGSGTAGDHLARIYRNDGNGLEATPFWKAKDRHSGFDCCLGDFDLDGDLDLAISAGDAYASEIDSARIYRNNGGVFDTLPCWTAAQGTPSDAVRFADIDNDGDLDLFVGQRDRISMYRNNSGILETTPSWVARQGVGWVLRLAFGDYDNDGFLDLAAVSNGQLDDSNSIKVFHNDNGTPDTIARFTMLRGNRYSSCVAWADCNGDGYADLAAGGWWEPAVVFENYAGVLDTLATWSWYPANPGSLVCETVAWADVMNLHLADLTETFSGNGQRKLFSLEHRPVQSLDSVVVDNVRLPYSGYCYDPLVGWFSLATAPPPGTDNIKVLYRHSVYPDLAVTNWEPDYPNYLFKNTTPSGICAEPRTPNPEPRLLSAWPNPFRGHTTVSLSCLSLTPDPWSLTPVLRIYDASGRCVRTLEASGAKRNASSVAWDGTDQAGRILPAGMYVCVEPRSGAMVKLVRLTD